MTPAVRITGATRLYAIVGDPIVQVRSPEVYTERFAAAGVNAVLLPVLVRPEQFDSAMPGLMALGNLDGLLVTSPYKSRMVAFSGLGAWPRLNPGRRSDRSAGLSGFAAVARWWI